MTKKAADAVEAPSRDGAFIHGLTLEGARWDEKSGSVEDSKPKELFCPMPVILVKAVTGVARTLTCNVVGMHAVLLCAGTDCRAVSISYKR